MSIFLLGKKLGKGSFGSVYEAENENGKKYAVKEIDTKKFQYIMEASIVSTYQHPNIVSSCELFIENGKLYIFQEKAICDLMVLTRESPLPLSKAKGYLFSICKALNFLHQRNIIHGDIKASNIFLYEDDVVKLGDFSVSVFSTKKSYTHKISTPSHNPPECFNEESWSFPIDMWCLGCTIYEIVYGKNIFPSQKSHKDFDKLDLLKICVFSWLSENEGIKMNICDEEGVDLTKNIKIRKVSHPNSFYQKRYKPVNNLIMNLLRCNPDKRIKIEEVISHYFFSKMKKQKNYDTMILKNKKFPIDNEEFSFFSKQNYSENILDIALKVFSLCSPSFREENRQKIIESCIVISFVIQKEKIPKNLEEVNPEIVVSHLGYSIHESL